MGRAALDARAAPAARAARAGVARAADRQALRAVARTAIVREEPYELTSVFGVGFADRGPDRARGRHRGRQPGADRGGAAHVLGEAERDGSTCLPVEEAASRGRPRCVDARRRPGAARRPRRRAAGSCSTTGFAYRPPTARARARAGAPRARAGRPPTPSPEAAATRTPGAGRSRARAGAAQLAGGRATPSRTGFSIVTGGPGTGKTATIKMICAAARAQDASVRARGADGPRGAARVGVDGAGRVDGPLGAAAGSRARARSTTRTTRCAGDLLVVDETSMANLELLVTLLRAVGPRMHVVLVGDADQLAPVGAGKPFAELVGTTLVPTAALTHIFRQAAGSMIVRGAHAVRAGPRAVVRRRGGRSSSDLFLIERDDPAAALDEIVTLVSRAAAAPLRRRPDRRHPGVRAGLPRAARDRRAQRAAARRAQPGRRAGVRRPPARGRQADALRAATCTTSG